jgi:hypothetical protein
MLDIASTVASTVVRMNDDRMWVLLTWSVWICL